MAKILLVEDEQSIGQSLCEYLLKEGFTVEWAKSIKESKLKTFSEFDLVILDWMLPDGQGIDLLRDIQKTPVIMLTAKNDLIDKVLGLETGAKDYLTKPFEPRELLARIRVQLRAINSQPAPKKFLKYKEIKLDVDTFQAWFNGDLIELTKIEFKLLKLFVNNPGRVFTRDELLNKVWGYDAYPTTRTVDNHLLQLRTKTCNEYFETLRGIGYRLKNDKEMTNELRV